MINVILQFLELDLVNINVSAKVYQNFPNGLRVKFHCFQNLNLGKISTNPKCGLTISWATSCQYQCVCKISSQYSISSRDRVIFTFSEFGARQSLDRWKMSFRNLLGSILLISMFRKSLSKYSTQFKRWGYFHFFRIWTSATPRRIQNDIWQSLGLNLVNINGYAKFYQNIANGLRVIDIFHEQAVVKIFTNCPVTKSNVWL